MSNPRRKLTDRTREVAQLRQDLQGYVESRRNWGDTVEAPLTLGERSEVELWFLASHFLITWHDWRGFRDRFDRYFGRGDDNRYSRGLVLLDEDCIDLAASLLAAQELGALVARDWATTGELRSAPNAIPPIRHFTHVLIQNHQRWAFMRDVEARQLTPHNDHLRQSFRVAESWSECGELVHRLNHAAFSIGSRLTGDFRADLLSRLRAYRRANLLLFWLLEEPNLAPSRNPSALLPLSLDAEIPALPSFESFINHLQDEKVGRIAGQVLTRVAAGVQEVGYASFYDDVTSPYFQGLGADSLVGSEAVAVLRGGSCDFHDRPLVLAVSKRKKRGRRVKHVLRRLRACLTDSSVVRAVVVLTDEWPAGVLDEHLEDLQAHHQRGVRFLFLLVGTPDCLVNSVAVDLTFRA